MQTSAFRSGAVGPRSRPTRSSDLFAKLIRISMEISFTDSSAAGYASGGSSSADDGPLTPPALPSGNDRPQTSADCSGSPGYQEVCGDQDTVSGSAPGQTAGPLPIGTVRARLSSSSIPAWGRAGATRDSPDTCAVYRSTAYTRGRCRTRTSRPDAHGHGAGLHRADSRSVSGRSVPA
jgi:hypothetical protein